VFEALSPASGFVTVDNDEARTPPLAILPTVGPQLVGALHILGELPCPSPRKDKNGKYVVRLVEGQPAIVKIQ